MTAIYFDYSRQGNNLIGGWGLHVPEYGLLAHGPLTGGETSEAGAMRAAATWLRAHGITHGHLIGDDQHLPRVLEKRHQPVPDGFTLDVCSRDHPDHRPAHDQARLGRTELVTQIRQLPLEMQFTPGKKHDCLRLTLPGIRTLVAHCPREQREGTLRHLFHTMFLNLPCPHSARQTLTCTLQNATRPLTLRLSAPEAQDEPTPEPDRAIPLFWASQTQGIPCTP